MPVTTVTIYHHTDGHFERVETGQGRPLRWAAWQPGGTAALLVGNRGAVLRYENGYFRSLPAGTVQNLRGVSWAADGTTALLVGNRGTVLVYHNETLTVLESPTGENLRRVAWHPTEAWALIVGNGGTVLRYEAEGQRTRLWAVPGDRAHTLRAIAFRPDGAYALVGAYASRWAGYPRPHALYRCDGRYLQALLATDDEDDFVAIDWRPRSGEALIAGYAWRPEGNALAPVNKLITYDGAGFTYRRVECGGYLWGAAWRPQGDYALLVGQAGLVLRYDGTQVEQLSSGSQENLVGPFWKPDGSVALILKGPDENVYTV